jgi:hypothetical protein
MARTTLRQKNTSPDVVRISKAPSSPVIEATAQPWRTLTLCLSSASFQPASTASRLPAPKGMGLRSGSTCGSAITCLPFWYL